MIPPHSLGTGGGTPPPPPPIPSEPMPKDAQLDAMRNLVEEWKKVAENRKAVLIAVLRGESCGEGCVPGGHFACYGCDDRIRDAVGMKRRGA